MADGSDDPLESHLEEIVAGFKAAAVQLAEQEQRRKEAEQRHRAEELRRYELERQRRIEAKRFRYILDAAAKWSEIREARAFLDRLEEQAKTEASDGALSNEAYRVVPLGS